jgi:gliding motility-associated-like protein
MVKTLRLVSLLSFFLSFVLESNAQLPYKESFTRSTAEGMVFGGRNDPGNHSAFLTANRDSAGVNGNPNDADGAGYLRLTKTRNSAGSLLYNQAGYVRNTNAFPSADGLSITFEYYTHGDGADYGYNQHGDGISVFLFDALAASTFEFGGYGGSLGYAQRTGGLSGVSKGFIGIGIDEFGNFATTEGGKSGGNTENPGPGQSDTWGGYNESSVTIRGDGDGNSSAPTNYEWLTTTKTYANLADFPGTLLPNAFLIRGNVDGRTKLGPSRTAGGLLETENGYRKVRVDLEPDGIRFKVNVWITEGKSGVAVPHRVIKDYMYTPTDGIPANLSYGFGASTGTFINIHEIRALDIVVPASRIKIPLAEPDVAVTSKNTPKTFNIVSNDHDPNGNFQLDLNSVDLDPSTSGVQTTFTVAGQGTYTYAVVGGEGLVTFTPVATFEGPATPISYTISDNGKNLDGDVVTGISTSAPATISVRVAELIAGTFTLCQGATTTLTNAATGGTWSSSAPGIATIDATTGLVTALGSGVTTITYTVGSESVTQDITVSAPVSTAAITGAAPICVGSTVQLASASPGGVWASLTPATATVSSTGLVTGIAAGTVTITYTVSNGACSDMKSTSITVSALPTVSAISGASTTTVGATISLTNTTASGIWSSDSNAIATVSSTGAVTGKSVGTTMITYTVTSNGCTTSVNKTVTVNASQSTNTPPIIADVPKTGSKDTPVPFLASDFTTKFSDTDPLTKIRVVSLPGAGVLQLDGVNIAAGQEIPVADIEKITFVPATGFTGGPVSFQWNGSDVTDYASSPKNVNITITSTNLPPVARGDNYTTVRGGTLTIAAPGVLSNDTDADGNQITAIKVSDPISGMLTFNANGSFVYTHNGSTSNSDTFTYKVNDGLTDGNIVTVLISVNAVNQPPLVRDVSKIGTGFTPIAFSLEDFTTKFADPEGSPLRRVRITRLPLTGTLRLNGSIVVVNQEITPADLNGLTYEPPVNWNGNVTFGWNGYDGLSWAVNNAAINLSVLLAGDPTAKIGLAKSLVSVKPALNGTYDIKFVFTAVNYGANGLERISVRDNLAQAFGGAVITVKSLTAIGNLLVNPSFNGTSDTELLNPVSKLIAGEEAAIELMINIRLRQTGGTFQNSATAEAYSALNGFKVSDISTNGLKPDPQVSSDVSASEATPILLEAQSLYSPQGFSPNGDGTNDKFVIQNTNGKRVSLEVYNRWGNRVYKADDYQNDWGGEVTEGFFVGREVPDGTYYYIIVIDNKDKYAGFITVNR